MPLAGLGLPGAAAMGMAGGPGALTAPRIEDDANEAEDAVRAIEPFRARYMDVDTEVVARIGTRCRFCTTSAPRPGSSWSARRRHGPFAVGAGYVVDGLLAHSPVPVAVIPVDCH